MPAARFMEPGMRQPAGTLDINELDTHVRGLLDEQRVEIRKDMLVSMETVARQTGSKLNRELDERLQLLSGRQPSGDRRSGLTLTVLIVLLFAGVWVGESPARQAWGGWWEAEDLIEHLWSGGDSVV